MLAMMHGELMLAKQSYNFDNNNASSVCDDCLDTAHSWAYIQDIA